MVTMPTDWMVYLNGVLVLWFLYDLYQGYRKGLLLQIIDVVGTFVSLFTAWLLSPAFVKVFEFVKMKGDGLVTINQLVTQQTNRLIWFVILFILIRILMKFVSPLAAMLSKMPLIKQVNSVAGGIFAVLFFGVKLLLIILFLSTPVIKNGQTIVKNTWLAHVDTLATPLVKQLDYVVKRNEAIQTIILDKKLPDNQINAVSDWLNDNGFTEREIKEFLNQYE